MSDDGNEAIIGFDTLHLSDQIKYDIIDPKLDLKMSLKEVYEDMISRTKRFALGEIEKNEKILMDYDMPVWLE